MSKLTSNKKYQLCVNYLEPRKSDLLHQRPKMTDLRVIIDARLKGDGELSQEDKISGGQLGDAMEKVFGFRSFRGSDRDSAFEESQKRCNHHIQWLIKLIESNELSDWVIREMRADPMLDESIRNAEPRTTLGVKRANVS